MSSNYDQGKQFEEAFAELIQGKIQPQSGGGWYAKLDVRGTQLLVSCKSTKHASFSLTPYTLQEAENAVWGPNGVGPDAVPAIAVELLDNGIYVTMKADEFVRLMTNTDISLKPTKGEEKRLRTKVPKLLRESKEDE